ncbi:MAG TPA: TonB-dependent receptor [Flavobacterium sp.]|nr:TonB-dependent receptor [Flavobacterium sp.]
MKTLFKNKQKDFKTRPRLLLFSVSSLMLSATSFAQEPKENDSIVLLKNQLIEEVIVSSVRATSQTPVTFTNIDKTELQSRNLGQDIPTLLGHLPSVVMTTDTGNGVGYSGIRVRGSDATRVNITINGVPYNDSESHLSYWVNLPDLVSSVENIQVQRGVGTSTNGSGAFGASINLLTDAIQDKATAELSNSFGSYNTMKNTVKFSTGRISDHFELSGRVSKIKSDGYIDRAWADMKSYFLQGAYQDEQRIIKAIAFGGNQQTYQAWNGLEDKDKLENDRTYNTSGEMYDKDGNFIGFYKNETDNYEQNHYQLHWNERLNYNWTANLAFHYTKGDGHYESYKGKQKLSDYGIAPVEINGELIKRTDLIRQKWLDNHFYGTVFSAQYKKEQWNLILGGGYNKYEGDHFGNVIWTREIPLDAYVRQYYFDNSTKTDLNFYSKANYQINSRWNAFVDLQYRAVNYRANAVETGVIDDNFSFFNPKAGVTYRLNATNNLYFSYAKAQKEPNREDYKNGSPKPERLNDFELGWRLDKKQLKINLNAYYMCYQDQLVLTGAISDTGAPIRENSGDSYRMGVEADLTIRASDKWIFRPTMAISQNKNINFYAERDGELKNLGNTDIAFSPDVILSNSIAFIPVQSLQISLLSKYVGEQYMSNLDLDSSKLDSYFVNDLNVSYEIKPKKLFETIRLSALVNNILDVKYISNGYFYSYDDDYSDPNVITTIDGAGYYPQATRNFLVGLTLIF